MVPPATEEQAEKEEAARLAELAAQKEDDKVWEVTWDGPDDMDNPKVRSSLSLGSSEEGVRRMLCCWPVSDHSSSLPYRTGLARTGGTSPPSEESSSSTLPSLPVLLVESSPRWRSTLGLGGNWRRCSLRSSSEVGPSPLPSALELQS